ANDGTIDSNNATVDIAITAVNDAPSFTKGADPTVSEDSGAQSVPGWATAISTGPADESGQTVSFNVTGNTNAGLFSAGPAVAADGTLTYTPAANANGSATITVRVQDDGGTAGGGVDTSATQTFVITVAAVNDAPVAQAKPTSGQIAVQANMKRVGIDAALLTGVTDADTGVSGCSPVFSVASISAVSGGAVSNVNLAAGTFDFDPTPGFTGTATVNYTVSDDGCPGVATSAPASISLTVVGPVIWFVNPAAGVNGSGTLASPFNVLSGADAVDAANHRVFVYSGTTTTGLALNSGEWLIGQAATGPFDTLFSITPPSGTIARPTMGTGTATIGGTVTLATNAKVQGVAISTGATNGLVGSGGITGINVSESKITTTTGTALNLNSATGTFALSSVSSNGAANGIVLNNTGAGTLTVTGTGLAGSGGSIQNTTGDGISLTNTQNVSLAWMNISTTGGSGVSGIGVTNFSFVNGVISGAGNASFESALAFNGGGTGFGNNIAGTLTVTDNSFVNPFYSGLDVQSDNGTVTNAIISRNTITNPGFSGVNLVGTGNVATSFSLQNASIDQNGISSSGGNGVQVSIGNSNATGPGATAGVPGDGTKLISITNNSVTLDSTGTNAILVANSGGNSGSRTKTNLLVQCNGRSSGGCTAPGPLNGSAIGTVVGIGNNGFSDMTGIVNNNLIDANHTANLGGGNGIGGGNGVAGAGNAWTPNLTLTVTNNVITDTDGNGILLVGRSTSGIAKLKIQNNTVAAPLGGVRPGIRVDAGNAASADDAVCLNISGNTSAGSGGSQGIGLRKQGTVATTNDFSVNGMAATATPGVETYVNGLNPAGGSTLLISATSGFSNCSLP
ncbi:MAG: Ig-like domain-containing protein, partial [Ilumatobacteraceae bacterium]